MKATKVVRESRYKRLENPHLPGRGEHNQEGIGRTESIKNPQTEVVSLVRLQYQSNKASEAHAGGLKWAGVSSQIEKLIC